MGKLVKALEGLLAGQRPGAVSAAEIKPPAADASVKERIRQANEAFESYLEFLGRKQYAEAGKALEDLESALKELSQRFNKR